MRPFLNRALIVFVLALLTTGVAAGQSPDNAPLTNAAIVKLVRSGFKEKTVISIVAARRAAYDLSPDRMIELKKSGVSEKIILAMLARQEDFNGLDDAFTDDPFFRDSSRKQKESQKSGRLTTAPTFLAQVEADRAVRVAGAEAHPVQALRKRREVPRCESSGLPANPGRRRSLKKRLHLPTTR